VRGSHCVSELRVDINVTTDRIGGPWTLTDLLGRKMGRIIERSAGTFVIEPEGSAVETMGKIVNQTYPSLDQRGHWRGLLSTIGRPR
jgi:hypothetical protein